MNDSCLDIRHRERTFPEVIVQDLTGDGGPAMLVAGKGRILLVDDNELLREATGDFLTDEGYVMSFAENGREALLRLRDEPHPDVILLDLRMPVMDGWEFRVIQKNDPNLALIPVIAISADGSPQAAAISAHAYLHKPIRSKDLLLTIERVLLETQRQG